MIHIRKSDLRQKNPKAVLGFLYAVVPEKFTKLADAQGVLIENAVDVENLSQMLIDREIKFDIRRFIKSISINSDEILASKDKVKIIE